ncbi:alanine racemase [Patescibacteria group bacterium]|nr:alanine racemase [Patescibacteria group bacterium]
MTHSIKTQGHGEKDRTMKRKTPLSYIEISKANLIHNFKQFKNLAKKGTKFAVVVKGNAYGHGQNEIVKILNPHTDYFFVDGLEELQLLRKVSQKKTFVFGYVQKQDLLQVIRLGCILAVFSIEQLTAISVFAKRANLIQKIHIPIDALLGREGFLFDELIELFRKIKSLENIKLSGIYAHFANIEDARLTEESFLRIKNKTHAYKQINRYFQALELAENFGFKNLQTHISSTSGLLAYEKGKGIHSIIRLGIGIYGMWPSTYLKSKYKNSNFILKPVLSWKTKIVQIKILPPLSTIGYGLTYHTKKETKIALIPQGYADGLDRRLSNKGAVLIAGTRCKILGRISMNMCIVDINHLKNIKPEEEVVILGYQGKEEITAEEIAKKIGTINYEITTRISPLLPRVVV